MDRKDKYDRLMVQAKSVIAPSDHFISRLASFVALVRDEFDWHWVGFYIADWENNELYLGPFHGPLACTRIPFDRGVCGRAVREKSSQVVADVHKVPDHIACSSLSNSEIVIPVLDRSGEVAAVLDIDSVEYGSFGLEDKQALESIIKACFS